MWDSVSASQKEFPINDYTKRDLPMLAFSERMASKNKFNYSFRFENICDKIDFKELGLACNFVLQDIPSSIWLTKAHKPLDFSKINRMFKDDNNYISFSYDIYKKSLIVSIWVDNEEQAEAYRKTIFDNLKFEEVDAESFICSFSYFVPGEGRSAYTSTIKSQHFKDISNNYTSNVSGSFNKLIDKIENNSNSAKLIIFNGPPGTGKTHAIKSFCSTLSTKYDIEFSLEPVNLLSNSSYMVQSLLTDDDKGKILILEDVDDVLKQSNKETYGDAISKFLNLLDGIIGQGRNFYVLVSCNTEEAKLSKAVTRPGRCLSYIEFECFNKETAIEWFKNKGIDESKYLPKLEAILSTATSRLGFRTEIKNPITLSEMYRILSEV
jgi:hypothetical protein